MKSWREWPIKKLKSDDDNFPIELKKIKHCPKLIYYRGNYNKSIFDKTISIVGSRRMTKYGQLVIGKLLPDLIQSKATVISGFMYGVDSECHRQTIEMGGKTIAVLGNGLDYLYPPENDRLYTDILENDGLVISEYEPSFKATLWSFPQRNRIVSGLATLGILVVEAGVDSGSLITAQYGLDQEKKVFTVPGPITSSTSKGTNWLISQKKAVMVTEISSIFGDTKSVRHGQIKLFDDLNQLELSIINLLEAEAMDSDEISKKIKKGVSETGALLSLLSLKGYITERNGYYEIKNNDQKRNGAGS